MNINLFSDATKQVLLNCGWVPTRTANLASARSILSATGISTSTGAENVLHNLLGLHLRAPQGGVTDMLFDVQAGIDMIDHEGLRALEKILGEDAIPIGAGGRYILFACPSGKLVFLQDEWLALFRVNGIEDALEFICNPSFRNYETLKLSS